MASLAQQFTGLRCLPLSTSRLSKPSILQKQNKMPGLLPIVSATIISNAQTKERLKLKKIFEDAHERGCIDLEEMLKKIKIKIKRLTGETTWVRVTPKVGGLSQLVWVRLWDFGLEFWEPRTLFKVASSIGVLSNSLTSLSFVSPSVPYPSLLSLGSLLPEQHIHHVSNTKSPPSSSQPHTKHKTRTHNLSSDSPLQLLVKRSNVESIEIELGYEDMPDYCYHCVECGAYDKLSAPDASFLKASLPVVYWLLSNHGSVKFNTNSAWKSGSDRAGYVWDWKFLWLEINSALVLDFLCSPQLVPWQLRGEGNQVADALVDHGSSSIGLVW
ncbi:hypothetical protein FF1_027301 [Malus domestica]